ncbi:hypothetical protein RirG_006830 [Rhizophagus irregularis DAOM 197198w]|uniref:Uncharacterized protein n=1 Tax=Rhizophagus irregularis (strain DAOM 197198w) TaxID=1432141 RepID=A0A015NIN8_RHIIW|nr:hypothetical protein RirG_006830 [Rhizophagus irregularis DAOM 197198w]
MINCVNYITNIYLPLILLNVIIILRILIIPNKDLMLMLLVEELLSDLSLALDLHDHVLNIIIVVILTILFNHHSSPPIPRFSQPQASPFPEAESMNQGWDNIEPSDPSRLSDNLMDFSSSVSPSNGSTFTAHSHIPLPPCMSLIPGPATLPQDRLSSLTATVTELTKTVVRTL